MRIIGLEGGHTSGVAACDVAKRHGRTKIDASGRIVAAHDACHVGADCVKTADDRAGRIQHLGVCVGLQTGERAKAAWKDLHGIERSVFDGRNTRIGVMVGVALFARPAVSPSP